MNTSEQKFPHAVAAGDVSRDAPAVQEALPCNDEHDVPIAYVLTPAAQQLLVPGSRPQLHAVPPLDDDDVARDPRRAQVKAMYRGGITPGVIAAQLELDVLLVYCWLDLPGGSRVPQPAASVTAPPVVVSETERRAVTERLAGDPAFAFSVGALAAAATIDEVSVTASFTDPAVAARVLQHVREHVADVPVQLHVVVRLGRRSHGDVVRSRWATALALDPTQVRTVRSRNDQADEALIRIVSADVAAHVQVWLETALQPPTTAVEAAF